MIRPLLAAALMLCLLSPIAHAQADALLDIPAEASLFDVLEQASQTFGVTIIRHPQLTDSVIHGPTSGLSLDEAGFSDLLNLHDLTLVESPGSPRRWLVMLSRSLPEYAATPRPLVEASELDSMPGRMLASTVIRLQHADMNLVFATLRAQISVDPKRSGNVLYVGDVLIFSDFVDKLRTYIDLVEQLDRAAEMRATSVHIELLGFVCNPDRTGLSPAERLRGLEGELAPAVWLSGSSAPERNSQLRDNDAELSWQYGASHSSLMLRFNVRTRDTVPRELSVDTQVAVEDGQVLRFIGTPTTNGLRLEVFCRVRLRHGD